MDLYTKIISIYSELDVSDFVDTIEIRNDSDGRGDYIAKWEHPTLVQPTQEELDGVTE
jgi:hypothetical protein